jgi:hypothetical protein
LATDFALAHSAATRRYKWRLSSWIPSIVTFASTLHPSKPRMVPARIRSSNGAVQSVSVDWRGALGCR